MGSGNAANPCPTNIMNTLPNTYYRRRFTDGRHHIFHSHGAGRVVRDDAEVLVFDWSHGIPQPVNDVLGWGIGTPRSRLFKPGSLRAFGRAWWWRTRPLNITQVFDPHGRLVVQRVDFASPAQNWSGGVYQTDLYLDCFVGADGVSYLIEDEDEVIEAEQFGLLTSEQRHAIESELTTVVGRIQSGEWLRWLSEAAGTPFDHTCLVQPRTYQGYWQTAASFWPEAWDWGEAQKARAKQPKKPGGYGNQMPLPRDPEKGGNGSGSAQ
jgi:hypothetical protein